MTDPRTLHRQEGPITSVEAAYSIDVKGLENLVYKTIFRAGDTGIISDQVRAQHPTLCYSSVTARYRSLLDQGFIWDSGDKAKGKSGRNQRIMVAAPFIKNYRNNREREKTAVLESSQGRLDLRSERAHTE